jgi:hypothetical protein
MSTIFPSDDCLMGVSSFKNTFDSALKAAGELNSFADEANRHAFGATCQFLPSLALNFYSCWQVTRFSALVLLHITLTDY